jgi:long-chain fatty acid transport protein
MERAAIHGTSIVDIGFRFFFIVVFLSSSIGPTIVWADGIRNPFQSSSAIGQGNAFRAQANDPSAIHYNPAGMTQLHGLQISGGFQFIQPHTEFQNSSTITTENEVPAGVGLPPPGQLFVTANLQDFGVDFLGNLVVGLGVENLYGFGAKYPEGSPLRTSVIKAQLPLLDIKPTIAYELTESLSLGLGADIFTFASFLGEGQAERQFISLGQVPNSAPGDHIEINGTGTTAGMNLSILLTPLRTPSGHPQAAFGFIWRSQAVLPLNGSLLVNGKKVANATSSIRFPESYEWGLALWPFRSASSTWKVEVDVEWVRWSSIRNFDTSLSTGDFLPNPQHWDDTINVSLGTEYTWLTIPDHPAWSVKLRGGYHHAGQAIPDRNFDPAISDAELNVIAMGFGLGCHSGGFFLGFIPCDQSVEGRFDRRSLSIDFSYQALFFNSRNVTGNPNPAVNGKYKFFTQGWGINFTAYFH